MQNRTDLVFDSISIQLSQFNLANLSQYGTPLSQQEEDVWYQADGELLFVNIDRIAMKSNCRSLWKMKAAYFNIYESLVVTCMRVFLHINAGVSETSAGIDQTESERKFRKSSEK